MGRYRGEQQRRKFVSTLPALLTSKCVRRCVDSGLLPATVYRAAEPTPEFNSNYFKDRDDHAVYAQRHRDWIVRGKTPSPPAVLRRQARPLRQRVGGRDKIELLRILQNGRCYLCCGHFHSGADRETIEHVTPKALGGKTHRNILLAHSSCNTTKADRKPRPCERIYLNAINLRRYDAAHTFDRQS